MSNIRLYKKIKLKEPILIAGWPGMGNVALGSVDYLRRAIRAKPFAQIEMSNYAAPDSIGVNDGITSLPELPKSIFYYTSQPEIIFFESEVQVGGGGGVALMEELLDFIEVFKVRRVFTGAAFPVTVTYKEPSIVYGVVNVPELKDWLRSFDVQIMNEGQISGLNGLLLGYAFQRGMEGVCLLATMPIYAVNIPNPKASKVIIEVLSRMIGFEIDMKGLDIAIKEIEAHMARIEGKMHEVFGQMKTKESKPSIFRNEKIPDHVMERIERLFQEAKVDKKKAYLLKEELDRWGLYKEYEDRFLDLFKENQ